MASLDNVTVGESIKFCGLLDKQMKKIYISIPITGHNEAEVRNHADLVKGALSRVGHHPVSPFDIYAGKNPSYADYLCSDLRALADCDAIFLCNVWQFSRGCRIERMFAEEFKKQIMYEFDPLKPITQNR